MEKKTMAVIVVLYALGYSTIAFENQDCLIRQNINQCLVFSQAMASK